MSAHFYFRGAKIAYQLRGKGRTIILLHGFLGSKKLWESYSKRLAKRFRVISLDIAGHGESECLGYVHDMELLAESIKTLLKLLNIRKAVVVGHSMGGYIGLAFAEKYPDLVLGLVLINSTAKGDTKDRIRSRDQLIKLIKTDQERAVKVLVPSFFNIQNRKTHHYVKKYLNMANNCSKQGIIASIEGMKLRKEREIVLKFAPFPYLIISGKFDSIISQTELLEQAKLNEGGQYVLLENSSHMSIWEEEEKVFKYLKEFSKRLRLN